MLRFKGLLALSLLALMVSAAAAQEERGRRRGGFGGFGGGMGGPVAAVGIPEVQQEINLSEEQKKQIDEGLAALRGGFNFQDLQNLSEEDREKRMQEFRTKAEAAGKAFEEKMNKVLKPEQLARLKQLGLQQQGAMALLRPEVAKDLGLTEEQRKKMQGILESSRPASRPNFQEMSQEERQKWMTENRERQEKTQAELLGVLTGEQKTKLAELKGKEFKFPEPRFGGFGGGNRERRRPPTKQE